MVNAPKSKAPPGPARAKSSVTGPNRASPARPASNRSLPPGRVSAPVASSKTMSGSFNGGDQSCVVRRREFVADILGSVTFANTQYNFNPGLSNLFPWLSQFANSYDEYVVQSTNFVYEPATTSANTGTVILSFDYDAADAAPVDKISALEAKDFVRSAPWVPARLVLKSSDIRKRCQDALFTRNGTVANTDIKTYDLGNLNVSTVGQTGTTQAGELWVEYVIQLRVPQRTAGVGQQISATSVSKTAPFTGTQTVSGVTVATATGALLTFQVGGYYLINHYITGTTLTAIGTPTASTGATVTLAVVAQIPTAATTAIAVYYVRVLSGSVLTFDDATGNTTVTSTLTDIAPWYRS